MHINWRPTDRQLRQFGWASVLFLPAIAAVWSHGASKPIGWALVVGLALAIVGSLLPRVLRPLFVGLSLVAMPIGIVVNEVALGAAFFLVMVPLGLVFHMMGRDALRLRIDRKAVSYWQEKRQPNDVRSYFRRW